MVANESGGSAQVELLYGLDVRDPVTGGLASATGRSAAGVLGGVETSADGDCSSCCSSTSSADEGGVERTAGLSTVLTSAPHLSREDDAGAERGHDGAVDASAAASATALIRQTVGDGDGASSDPLWTSVAAQCDDECAADGAMQPLAKDQMGTGVQVLAAPSTAVAMATVPKLKSALKRPTHLSHGGQVIDRLAAKKNRVKFNEALNTFLECDYVIYVDDDEYDLLCCYDYEAAAACSQSADEQPKLVSVRAFELQLPESSVTLVAGGSGEPPTEFVDQVTLSPPDGYKDAAAALYAASFCLASHHHLQQADDEEEAVVDDVGCMTDSGAESPADETAPAGSDWPMNQSLGFGEDVDVEPAAYAAAAPVSEEKAAAPAPDESAPVGEIVEERPPEVRPLNGILKGGKYWRGAASAAAASGSSGASGDSSAPKSTAVRFISINGTDPSDPDYRMTICAAGQGDDDVGDQGGGSGSTGNAAGRGSHSAFQQLFPRARKLLEQQQQLQSLPQAHHHHPMTMEPHLERYTEFRVASAAPAGSTGPGRNVSHSDQEPKYGDKTLRSAESTDSDAQSEEMLLLEALRQSHGGSASAGAESNEFLAQGFNNEELNDDMVLMDMHKNLHNLNVHHAASATHEQIRKAAVAAAELAVIRRTTGRTVEIKQRRNDADRSTDSLVERLKWLTTTDDDTPIPAGAEALVEEVREAADGTSDTHSDSTLNALDASAYNLQPKMAIPVAVPVVPAQIRPILRPTAVMVEATAVPATVESSEAQQAAAAAAAPSSKSGKSGEKSSTYRKLNDLFFRGGKSSKEKQSKSTAAAASSGAGLQPQQSWKSSTSSINRSFSPPPPAEVEPSKLKPTASSKKLHLVHFVGIPKASHGHAPQAAAASASGPSETLGRIPNVVPTVDHIYRSAVDLVVARTAKEASADSSGGDSYSLDDIDAALVHPVDPSASGGGPGAFYLHATRVGSHLAEELREEAGGSRSSGSSGDSGLGSHDTSMANGSDSGDTAADSSNDELQAFVQQDQGRIDRLKKRYNPPPANCATEDGEAEDYGFLRRPSVRGIKPRFGSTSEIIQQMQAQLAPPALASKAAAGSHITWPYPGCDPAQQSHPSQHVQALLDPRCSTAEKRRAAMTTSVHLPALHEDVYYQGHGSANIGVPVMVPSSRPASVMNIYGSTGDLYQHLHAQPQQRPLLSASSSAAHSHHPHLLERTSSVSSVASVDANALYGTIRRAPYAQPQPIYGTYNPAAGHQPIHPHQMQQQMQQMPQQMQQQMQQPLRQSISNPMGGTLPANYRPMAQVVQVVPQTPGSAIPAQRPPDYQQLSYPAAVRQSPYGVPCTAAPGVVPVAPMIDPRYRQVLPMMAPHPQPQVVLRPTQVDPRLAAPAPAYQPPPQPPAASTTKDEREGPEGASSSPGLTGDVNM